MNTRWQILSVAASLLIAGSLIWAFAVSPSRQPAAPQVPENTTPAPLASAPSGSPPGDQATTKTPVSETPASENAAAQQKGASPLAPPSSDQPPPTTALAEEPPGQQTPRPQTGSPPSASQPPAAGSADENPPSSKDPLALYPAGDIPQDQDQTYEDIWARPIPVPPEAQGLKRLTKQNGVWVDPKRRRVVIAGRVVLRRGALEMFACPRQTKEHESVVGVNTKAYVVHAALLALGVEPGRPVQFDPEYRPAQGPEIRVLVCWTDPQGRRRCVPAQKWIRNVKTKKEMQHPWLFTGSQWWESPDGKQRYYMAEQGDFICVSNFPTAMLDLPIRSSNAAAELLFAAYTPRIPPLGTDVALILEPVTAPKPNAPAPPKNKADSQPNSSRKKTPVAAPPAAQPDSTSLPSPKSSRSAE